MRSTISSKSGMILPKASCMSITASAARLRSSSDGCLIKMPLYTDSDSGSKYGRSSDKQKGENRKMKDRKIRTASERSLFFFRLIFSARPLKISLDTGLREYYFHSVLAQ